MADKLGKISQEKSMLGKASRVIVSKFRGRKMLKKLAGHHVVLIGILIILAGSASYVNASGPLNPPEPPGPTMRSLDEIYVAITSTSVTPAAIRSGTYWWDYQLGRSISSLGPFTLLTVNSGKTFILTDIYISGNINHDMKIYEGTNVKFIITSPYSNYHFRSGIPFSSGQDIQMKFYSIDPANVFGSITISGYEF